jgi:hypothetical protein
MLAVFLPDPVRGVDLREWGVSPGALSSDRFRMRSRIAAYGRVGDAATEWSSLAPLDERTHAKVNRVRACGTALGSRI